MSAAELPGTADVVVVGAGVVGASIAFHLARLGHGDVVLLDKGHVGAANSERSGALVRMHYTTVEEALFARASLPWFEEWADRVGGDCGFTRTGFLQLVGEDDITRLRRNTELLHQQAGVETRPVEGAELADLAPGLRLCPGEVAAYEPRGGYADGRRTAEGFAEAARHRGVTVAEHVAVTGLVDQAGRITGVQTTAGKISCGTVVLANGGWSLPLAAGVGLDLPIELVRVQVAFFRRPADLPAGHDGPVTFIDRRHGIYARPDGAHDLLIGLSAYYLPEQDPDNVAGRPEPGFHRVARDLGNKRVPGLDLMQLVRAHNGLLDVTPDRRMILGPAGDPAGLVLAVGMSGAGFKKSPAIGLAVAEHLTDGHAASVPIDAFHLDRFARGEPLSGQEYSLPPEATGTLGNAQALIH